MGLQFPSCTTFELIEVFIPDQPHQELTAKEIMGLKMAVQQQQGNWGGGRAAEAGQLETVKKLIDEGANVNAPLLPNHPCMSPLYYAAVGRTPQHVEIGKLLTKCHFFWRFFSF